MQLIVVVLAVAGGWFLLGLVFWAILIGRGLRFELRGTAIPRITRTPLTLAHRDGLLASVREEQARKSAITN
jgi:hypothetical protein